MIDDPLTPDVGVLARDDATTRWRVWAGRASRVDLVIDPKGRAQTLALEPEGRGYFSVVTTTPEFGTRYGYSIDGGSAHPDPASRWQPEGVNEPSAVAFPAGYAWDEGGWTGVERRDLVFYELHVGTFTPEGTLDAIMPRLDSLKDLGVTAVELMPVAQFPGRQSWGYDAVHPLAVQNTYGGPEALQRFVAACHRKGLAVVLDVVYNHFGPEGNVLPEFGEVYNERYRTDWGPAVNFDGKRADPIRALVLQSARAWVRDFRVDGLRLDAADQIYDRGPRHILSELAEVAHGEGQRLGRNVHVFAETDLNDAPRFIGPPERGGYGIDGHWNDDFHHAVHAALTGESNGYYEDFADGPNALAKVYREVFVNNGSFSPFRGRRHGAPATEFAGDRFVAFIQNHDQVGNRLTSDRYAARLSGPSVRLAAGLLLLAPRLPLLFMGEEYGETNPFPFFCDFRDPALVKAVRDGRKAEFAYFGWSGEPPDPFSAATRVSAVLSWSWEGDRFRAGLRRLYHDLLRLRKELASLRDFRHSPTRLVGPDVLEAVRGGDSQDDPASLSILFNLGRLERALPDDLIDRRVILRSEVPRYGAPERAEEGLEDQLAPGEFVVLSRTVLSTSLPG